MLPRIQRQGRLLGLFILGAVLPLAVLLGMLALGAALPLLLPQAGPLLAGVFLLSNGAYGLIQAFHSFPKPQGRPLKPDEAPALLALLDELAEGWRGPRSRDVVLDPAYWTLDLVGAPTLGLLGWVRFRWLVGVNPLLALSPREFEVLASWEMVWWSDQQGWLNLQVKRVAAYWHRMAPRLEAQTGKAWRWRLWFLAPYGRWIRTRLDPFLFQELLNADQAVARHYGSGTLARALSRLAILKPLLERRVFQAWGARIDAGEALPERLYPELSRALAHWPEGGDALLELALDGHVPEAPPLLRLRLGQLSEAPTVPLPNLRTPLADELEEAGVLREFEVHWREGLLDLAERRSRQAAADAERFAVLRSDLEGRFPEGPDSLEFLRLAYTQMSPEAFERLCERFLAIQPSHREAEILVYRNLLRQGRIPEAETLAARLAASNPFNHEALTWAHWEHQQKVGSAKVDAAWAEARRAEHEADLAREERQSAGLEDDLESHGLSAEVLAPLVEALSQEPRIRMAYLLRKRVVHLPDSPTLLLVAIWRSPVFDARGEKRSAYQTDLARKLPFPKGTTAFVLVITPGGFRRHRRKVSRTGPPLFRR